MRVVGDHLLVAGDGLVVAVGARQRPRAVERGRRRLVARQVRHRRQQHLAGLGVVAPHVELGHADLVVALGRLIGRQRGGQAIQLGQRLVPVAVLGQRFGAPQAVGRRQRRLGGGRGRRGRGGGRARRAGLGCPAQGLVGQRMGGELAGDGQQPLARPLGVAGRQLFGDAEAQQRHVGGGGRGLLQQAIVSLGGRRPIALHPLAVGDAEGRQRGRAAGAGTLWALSPPVRRPRAPPCSPRRKTRSRPAGTPPSPRCGCRRTARPAALSPPRGSCRRGRPRSRVPGDRPRTRRLLRAERRARRRRSARGRGAARRHLMPPGTQLPAGQPRKGTHSC